MPTPPCTALACMHACMHAQRIHASTCLLRFCAPLWPQAVDATNTPQWLLDAASDMAAGGATAGNSTGTAGVFGASTGVGGGSGTAASQPIEISSGGLLHHVRSLLLLRPVALHDVWLRKVRAAAALCRGVAVCGAV